MKTGRNEPCSCGSGKKSKHCCGASKHGTAKSSVVGVVVAAIVVVATVAVIVSIRSESGNDSQSPDLATKSASATTAPLSSAATATAPAAPVATPGPQPPGPAPAGKIWSPEHGHWHDQPQANPWVKVEPQPKMTPIPMNAGGKPLIPQPATPVPAGMVWSPEHGHWHDAKTGEAPRPEIPPEVAAQMRKPGIPEAAKDLVWNEEHKHWHRKDGTTHATASLAPPAAATTAPATTTATSTDPY